MAKRHTQKSVKNQQNTSTMSDIVQKTAPFRVIKTDSNRFVLDVDGQYVACAARKKVKLSSEIVPGDMVLVEQDCDDMVVTEVLPRKNRLIRPQVSNIDQVVAVAALVPKPDYYLIDKLIVNANKQGIDVIICLNKSDLSRELHAEFQAQYQDLVRHIVVTSAIEDDVSDLYRVLDGKLSCFAGQSAVGKSSLVNALLGQEIQKTDEVSEKSERGKNTTTRAEIIRLSQNTYIVDTPGFSMLDIHDISPEELDLYYPEYVEVSSFCKYHRCSHTVEPLCKVRELAQDHQLNRSRYERYLVIRQELKNKKPY